MSANESGLSVMDVQIYPQMQLLSRLQYIINTGSQFCFLKGGSGVGKSFVSNLLVEQLHHILLVKIKCRKNFNLESFQQELICQLATDDLSELNQPLAQALSHASDYHKSPILIVIDNADYMPQSLIHTLLQSFNEFLATGPNHQVNILLVGELHGSRSFIESASINDAVKMSEYQLDYLSVSEANSFLSAIHPDWSSSRVDNYIKSLAPDQISPRHLIYHDAVPVEAQRSKLLLPVLVVVTSVILTALFVWWLNSDNEAGEITELRSEIPNQTFLVAPPQPQTLAEVKTEVLVSAELPLGSPEMVVPEIAVQEIIVPEVVQEIVPEIVVVKTPIEQALVVVKPTEVPLVASVPELANIYAFDEKLLLDIPSKSVALMLGGYSQRAVLDRVVSRLNNRPNIYIYQTIRNGKEWFVLLYGTFANRAQANKVLSNMPADLVSFSPWIKSFKAIQAEIIAATTVTENNS